MRYGPDPNALYPNPDIPGLCYIKNAITRLNILVGEYTYYHDDEGNPAAFEDRVTHHYEFLGDRLIIGRFCAIGKGVQFIMNGANHRMDSATTYPFNILGGGWARATPEIAELPFKGDTVVGNDVWIGEHVTLLPGVHIGDGAIIAAHAVITKDVPAYHIAGGNPGRILKKRFDDERIAFLLALKWWDWPIERIDANLERLCSSDPDALRALD